MNETVYITTAIDYVNGQPHLGHAYEKWLQTSSLAAFAVEAGECFF